MARPVTIPMPLKGMNTVDSMTQDMGYAREISDLAIYNGRLISRPFISTTRSATYANHINWFDYTAAVYYGIERAAPGETVNLDTGAVLGNIGGACQANATTCKHVSIELLFGCQAPRSPVGPAFTAWTFTTAAITATAITCGCSWKGRLYVSDGTSIEYSNLGAVGASALNGGVPISYNMAGQSVIRMLTFTGSSQANILTDSLFAIFGSGGRVLVYSGNDPTDWVQIGQWDMPAPISNLGFVEVDGDLFISTNLYAYWARDLLNGGAAYAYSNSPSKPIENLWQFLGWDSSVTNPAVSHSFYIDEADDVFIDTIIVQCSSISTLSAVDDVSTCCLVYFRKYAAWAIWFTDKTYAPFRAISSSGSVLKFILTSDTSAIGVFLYSGTFDPVYGTWSCPYLAPFSGKNQRLVGVRPFYRTLSTDNLDDTPGALHEIGAVANFSDFNSPFGFQAKPGALNPIVPGVAAHATIETAGNAYDRYQPYAAIGLDGSGVSAYGMMRSVTSEGVAPVTTREIYQMIAYFEDGGDLY